MLESEKNNNTGKLKILVALGGEMENKIIFQLAMEVSEKTKSLGTACLGALS